MLGHYHLLSMTPPYGHLLVSMDSAQYFMALHLILHLSRLSPIHYLLVERYSIDLEMSAAQWVSLWYLKTIVYIIYIYIYNYLLFCFVDILGKTFNLIFYVKWYHPILDTIETKINYTDYRSCLYFSGEFIS